MCLLVSISILVNIVCKVTYFFVHVQIWMTFYASGLKKSFAISKQKVITLAEAMLINNAKSRSILDSF